MKRPNILFILSDDQCPHSLGILKTSELKTPNLDSIAREGQIFTNCFCASPVCSPARASILTGTMPSHHGVHDWIRGGNIDRSDAEKLGLTEQEFRSYDYQAEHEKINYLEGLPTYTEVLAGNGYNCALSGKWHLGSSTEMQCGFTKWYTIAKGGCRYMDPDIVSDGKITFPKKYVTDLISDRAVEFVDELVKEDKPFYLSLHYTAPHAPWEHDNHKKEHLDLYKDCDYDKYYPRLPDHPWANGWSRSMNRAENRSSGLMGYEAAVTAMDEGIGRVIDELKKTGVYDDTVIIFTSDNGFNLGHHGIFGKGNGTWPTNVYDEAVKVPFIIRWKNHIRPGIINKKFISHYDIFPTILDIAGIDYVPDSKQPGKSFTGDMTGNCHDGNNDVFIFDEYGDTRMIRTEKYKYVYRRRAGFNELYDMENDPSESRNLIGDEKYKDIIKELQAKLNCWFRKYTDPDKDGTLKPATGGGQLRYYTDKGQIFDPGSAKDIFPDEEPVY